MGIWKWVYHFDETAGTQITLRNVGILTDGTLHNPHGYPEDIVRAAIKAAEARVHERRSNAAKKAAITRARRQERKILETARRIVANAKIGPRDNCIVCGRGLGDPESINRGIGSECWQDVLNQIERLKQPAMQSVA